MEEMEFSENTSKIYEYFNQNPLPSMVDYMGQFAKQGIIPCFEYSLLNVRRGKCKLSPDSEFGFELKVDENILATLNYDYYKTYRGVENLNLVKQIKSARQETKDQHASLKCIKWERMLLKIFEDVVVYFGFNIVGLQPAEQSNWYNERYWEGTGYYKDSVKDHQSRMRMRYNVTSKRNGFRFDEKTQLFLKRFP